MILHGLSLSLSGSVFVSIAEKEDTIGALPTAIGEIIYISVCDECFRI